MPQLLTPADVCALPEYERVRNEMRRQAVVLRKRRRVSVGPRVSVTFENRDTVLFQLHETIRAEGITGPDAIEAECEVYGALLPSETELSATMSISVSSHNPAAELRDLAGICEAMDLAINGCEVHASVEDTNSGDMASITCYLRFGLTAEQVALLRDPSTSVMLRVDHPKYREEAMLTAECRRLIGEDLV